MRIENLSVLLFRPDDLVLLRAELSGFTLDNQELTPSADAAITLDFPPQALGETVLDPVTGRAATSLAGTSRITVKGFAAGVRAPFTVAGILQLVGVGTPVDSNIELPWRLHLGVDPADNPGLHVTPTPPPEPGRGGVWTARLSGDGPLRVNPFDPEPDESLVVPLNSDLRGRIVAESRAESPTTPWIDLTSLGGTLAISGDWETFSWHQRVVLGRDLEIRTESRGWLYPWGHRASLLDVTVRTPVPPDGANVTMGLQQQRLLIVAEPVVARPADPLLARCFPFSEVEVLQPVMEVAATDVVPEDGRTTLQPTRLDDLRAQLESAQGALGAAEQRIVDLFASANQAIDDNAAATAAEVSDQLAAIGTRIAELEEIQRLHQEALDALPDDPPPPPIEIIFDDGEIHPPPPPPPPPPPIPRGLSTAEFAELAQLNRDSAALMLRLNQIEAERQAGHQNLNSEDALAGFGVEFADAVAGVRALRESVPTQAAAIQTILDRAAVPIVVFAWPQAREGVPLLMPLRCDDLRTRSPVLFVQNVDFDADDDFPALKPLTDQSWLDRIAAAWAGNPEAELDGRGAVVNFAPDAGAPQPNDALPVRRLAMAAVSPAAGQFRPQLVQAEVVLKAVAELVPGLDGLARVAYHPDFVRNGAGPVALALATPLGIDFAEHADAAGGLVSPVIATDVLSRLHGPVNARSLTGFLPEPPDPAAAFGDTTLLGIPLSDLLDPSAIPQPLKISPTPDGGVQMSWPDIRLHSVGPFRARPQTVMRLSVQRSPSLTETVCTITDFDLVLPPAAELVVLHFDEVTFTQVPGRAPSLEPKGFAFRLSGPLALLQTLQEKVSFGGTAPRVTSVPGGISAGFRVQVPEVAAGMFVMRNIAASVDVEVPFDRRPIVTRLAFASREDPFTLAVSVFGGRGYLVFEVAGDRITRFEASLDFGAMVAVNVGVASAEVHAFGGVRITSDGSVTGFLNIGGSVDVLGLVSVSVELRVELSFVPPEPPLNRARLTGRATAVIEIDVTFWSGSISLDTGVYTFLGPELGGEPGATAELPAPPAPPTPEDWKRYRDAFQRA